MHARLLAPLHVRLPPPSSHPARRPAAQALPTDGNGMVTQEEFARAHSELFLDDSPERVDQARGMLQEGVQGRGGEGREADAHKCNARWSQAGLLAAGFTVYLSSTVLVVPCCCPRPSIHRSPSLPACLCRFSSPWTAAAVA